MRAELGKRGGIALLVATPLFFVCMVALYQRHMSYEDNEQATVRLQVGGESMTATCSVYDRDGKPAPGVYVKVDNDSGGSGEVTDENGTAVIKPGETEVLGI